MAHHDVYEKRNVLAAAENFNSGIVNFFMDVDGYECYILKQDGRHDFTHTNRVHDEVLFIVQGTATILLNDEKIELATGDLLRIPMGVTHADIVGDNAVILLFEMKG